MRYVVGIIALVISFLASLMLVLEHIVGMSLPGCGPGSPCAEAAASAWGELPGLGWPTSFAGLAYFAAMLIAWVWTGGVLRATLTGIAIVAGVVSIILTVAMLAGNYLCHYCLAVHLGNLVFVGLVLSTMFTSYVEPGEDTAGAQGPRSGLAPFVGAIVAATACLFLAESLVSAEVEQKAERDLAETSEALAQRTEEPEPFTGRYLTGLENAPIRLVVFSDYQCKDCRRIEGDIRELLAERDDLSLSAKHFPMSSTCNTHMNSNPHPNACWAARAAEAAGILRGNDGFWQMHHWLFDRGGGFTDPEIHAALREMGYDVQQFINIMTGPETEARVLADIEEAVSLGIHYTPMIFINGVELKGWNAPNAMRRMVEQVAATNPEAAPPTADQPPTAVERYIADFRAQFVRQIPDLPMTWPAGANQPSMRIVMWGDYQEPYCAKADAQIRAFAEQHPDVRYEFHPYPFDQACNRFMTMTKIPHGCIAARAALAAGHLGGADAYWAAHERLMSNQVPMDANALAQLASAAGLDVAALQSAMTSAEVAGAIDQSTQAGKSLGLNSIPMIFINGRWVPRTSHRNEPNMLTHILEAARATP